MSEVQIYTAVGRVPDISKFKCKDIFLNGEYIGTYQPELWHGRNGIKILKDCFSDIKECE